MDLVERLRFEASERAKDPEWFDEDFSQAIVAAADEIERLRDIEVTYEQIRRIAANQSYDAEMNSLEWPASFTDDLWKVGIFDILHPAALTRA